MKARSRRLAKSIVPRKVFASLSAEHQQELESALASNFASKHPIDVRGTIPVPFAPKRFYFVLLAGIDRRNMTRGEYAFKLSSLVLLVAVFFTLCTLLGLSALYITKSLLGINLFSEFSLGLL